MIKLVFRLFLKMLRLGEFRVCSVSSFQSRAALVRKLPCELNIFCVLTTAESRTSGKIYLTHPQPQVALSTVCTHLCSSYYAFNTCVIKIVIFNGGHLQVIFHTIRKDFATSGSKLFPLREVPILVRYANEENHCLIQ